MTLCNFVKAWTSNSNCKAANQSKNGTAATASSSVGTLDVRTCWLFQWICVCICGWPGVTPSSGSVLWPLCVALMRKCKKQTACIDMLTTVSNNPWSFAQQIGGLVAMSSCHVQITFFTAQLEWKLTSAASVPVQCATCLGKRHLLLATTP